MKGVLSDYGAAHIALFGEKIEFGKADKIHVQVQRKGDTLLIKKNGTPMTIQLKEALASKPSDVVIFFGAWDSRASTLLVNSVGINADVGTLKDSAPAK